MVKYDGAVYLDSPIASALRQVTPFHTQGTFRADRTLLLTPRGCSQMNLKMVGAGKAKRLPVKRGGTIFYNFNSQGNIDTVANRSYRHILVLHGESNKRAPARPAARLYDYICMAGDIAAERYVSSGIFRSSEVDDGRILKMGDTFVQDLDHYVADPYLGLLSPTMHSAFWAAIMVISKVAELHLDLASANTLTKSAGRIPALATDGRVGVSRGDDRVALCLCHASAMESVCLKAGLPHFVLLRNFTTPESVALIYAVKSAADRQEFRARFPVYIVAHHRHGADHHTRTFGYSHAAFRDMRAGERVCALMAIAAENRVWQAPLQ